MSRRPDAPTLAERVLGTLEEGSFSATCNYALLTAILDLCVDKSSRDGVAPTLVTTRQLEDSVTELYWSYVVPFATAGVPRQGGVTALSRP